MGVPSTNEKKITWDASCSVGNCQSFEVAGEFPQSGGEKVWECPQRCPNNPGFTHWKFNSEFAPEKLPGPKRNVVFQSSFFRGYVKLRGFRN